MKKRATEVLEHVSEEQIAFTGVCELQEDGEKVLVNIYSSFEDAVNRGVSAEMAMAVFRQIGQKPGSCSNLKLGRTINCLSWGCTGACTVFSLARGPIEKGQEPRYEGKGPVVMLKKRFYWCSCV